MANKHKKNLEKQQDSFSFVDDSSGPDRQPPPRQKTTQDDCVDLLQKKRKKMRQIDSEISLTAKIKKDLQQKQGADIAKRRPLDVASKVTKRLEQELLQNDQHSQLAENPEEEDTKKLARDHWDAILSSESPEEDDNIDRLQRIKWLKDLADREQIGLTAKIARSLAKYNFFSQEEEIQSSGGGGGLLLLLLFIILGAIVFGLFVEKFLLS